MDDTIIVIQFSALLKGSNEPNAWSGFYSFGREISFWQREKILSIMEMVYIFFVDFHANGYTNSFDEKNRVIEHEMTERE